MRGGRREGYGHRLALADGVRPGRDGKETVAVLHMRDMLRTEVFDDVSEFLERIVAVDPERDAVIRANPDAIAAAVLSAATRTKDGRLMLDQPIKAAILERA